MNSLPPQVWPAGPDPSLDTETTEEIPEPAREALAQRKEPRRKRSRGLHHGEVLALQQLSPASPASPAAPAADRALQDSSGASPAPSAIEPARRPRHPREKAVQVHPLAHHHEGRTLRSRPGLPRSLELGLFEPDEPGCDWQLPPTVPLYTLSTLDWFEMHWVLTARRDRRRDRNAPLARGDGEAWEAPQATPAADAKIVRRKPPPWRRARQRWPASRLLMTIRRFARRLLLAAFLVAALVLLYARMSPTRPTPAVPLIQA